MTMEPVSPPALGVRALSPNNGNSARHLPALEDDCTCRVPPTPNIHHHYFYVVDDYDLVFLSPAFPLSKVQKEKMQGNSKTTNPIKATHPFPMPSTACCHHQTAIE
jgi:hypothetical protein